MSTSRLSALADGVFSIVMTLLVFEFHVPVASGNLTDAVVNQWPTLVSYIISFVILGVYWVGHHAQFQYIRKADQNLLWTNILFLGSVALIPFSAGMLAQHGSERLSVILYGVNLIVVAGAHFLMWHYATRKRRLVDGDLPDAVVALGKRLSLIPVGVYVLAIMISFSGTTLISIALYALVPVPYVTGWLYRNV